MTTLARLLESGLSFDRELPLHDQIVAKLGKIAAYPDIDHALTGIDSETGLPVSANITVSLNKDYACYTCASPIKIEEKHVVVSGIYSYRSRDRYTLDHHHLHKDCFTDNELPAWDTIAVVKMSKDRREEILQRFRKINNRA